MSLSRFGSRLDKLSLSIRYPGRLPRDCMLTQREMIERQIESRGITNPRVLAALHRVPRDFFVPPAICEAAHDDRALPIGCDQTISQPYIVALMTEALQLTGVEHVLEIGTGSGYQTALLAELAHDVVTIERHARLSRQAQQLLDELGYENVRFLVGDGAMGWPPGAPYDRILVAAATSHWPEELWRQLAEGGILVAPLGEREVQELAAFRKVEGQPQPTALCECRFVPLVEGAVPEEE